MLTIPLWVADYERMASVVYSRSLLLFFLFLSLVHLYLVFDRLTTGFSLMSVNFNFCYSSTVSSFVFRNRTLEVNQEKEREIERDQIALKCSDRKKFYVIQLK